MSPKQVHGLPPNLTYDRQSGRYRYRWARTGKRTWIGRDREQSIEYAERLNRAAEFERLQLLQRQVDPTLGDVIDLYLQLGLPELPLSDKTRAVHEASYRRYKGDMGAQLFRAVDRLAIADWIYRRSAANFTRNRHRLRWVRLYEFAIARKWCDFNEADATPRYSQSMKLPGNQVKRKRMDLEFFWQVHDVAPVSVQIAMQLSLVTLQAEQEVCNMQYSDIREGYLYVIRRKVAAESEAAFIKIALSPEIERIVRLSRQSGIVSPYIVHRIRRSKAPHAKYVPPHPTYVRPKALSQHFGQLTTRAGLSARYATKQRPTFHEIRSLGARLMEQQGYPKTHVQMLMAHGSRKTTEIYLDNRAELSDGDYIAVDAPLVLSRG